MHYDQTLLRQVIYTAKELVKASGNELLYNLLDNSVATIEETGYDNWNGGTSLYTLCLSVELDQFVKISTQIEKVETDLLERINIVTRHFENDRIVSVRLVPNASAKVEWDKLAGITTQEKLQEDVEWLRNIMITVATGGPSIKDVNDEYKSRYSRISIALAKLGFSNPNQFKDLWEWYGMWSSNLSTWAERRAFISRMYDDLIDALKSEPNSGIVQVAVDVSDWDRVDRSLREIQSRKAVAETEEQCQAIGLLCRDTIISLAQVVYVLDKHPIADGVKPSKTDAKRMIEAYISAVIPGASNDTLRRYARATLELANDLTHRRTATKVDASLCASATVSLVNLMGTLEGRF